MTLIVILFIWACLVVLMTCMMATSPVVDETKCKHPMLLIDGECQGPCALHPPCATGEDE